MKQNAFRKLRMPMFPKLTFQFIEGVRAVTQVRAVLPPPVLPLTSSPYYIRQRRCAQASCRPV